MQNLESQTRTTGYPTVRFLEARIRHPHMFRNGMVELTEVHRWDPRGGVSGNGATRVWALGVSDIRGAQCPSLAFGNPESAGSCSVPFGF